MKKIFTLPIILAIAKMSIAQNVGIGTTTPVAGLHILSNNGIIAKGDTLSSNPYILTETGAGAKLIWHPKKAAFMVGRLDNFGDVPNRWDEDSIGFGAMNLGYANKVKGQYSFATGIGNIVSGGGFGSIAMGHNSFADSNECVAIGFSARALQRQAIAIGTGVVANGRSSFVTGYASYAGGYVGTAGGAYSRAEGDYSFCNGYYSTAKGEHSFSQGYGNYSGAKHSFTAGILNSVFEFISPYEGARSAVAFGSENKVWGAFSLSAGTLNNIDSAGYNAFVMGFENRASNNEAIAMGNSNSALGKASIAVGTGSSSIGDYSVALGYSNNAYGKNSFAVGTGILAYGDYSVALGHNSSTTATAQYSVALGRDAQATCVSCIVMGSPINNETNVVIGISDPSHARLEIRNTIGAAVAMFGSDKYGVTIQADNPEVGFNYFYNGGWKAIKAGYASVAGMNPSTGEFYIGNFNGNQSSTDFGSITGYRQNLTLFQNGEFRIAGTTNFTHFMYGANEDTYIRGGKTSSNVIIGDLNTAVVIGNAAPLAGDKLTIQGGNLRVGGSIVVTSNICAFGTIGSCSDIRYKTNFSSIQNPLQKIQQLNAIYYNWKQDEFPQMNFNNEKQLGLSAQEVEKYFPEMVQTNADGYKAVDYSRLAPVLIEGMKEQQLLIETLQKENTDLKARIDRLEKLLLKQ